MLSLVSSKFLAMHNIMLYSVNQQIIMDLSRISLAVAQVLIFPKMQVEKNTSEAAVYGKSNATLEKL